jgi:hypothetical protein
LYRTVPLVDGRSSGGMVCRLVMSAGLTGQFDHNNDYRLAECKILAIVAGMA